MIEINIHKKLQAARGEMDLDLEIRIEKGELITLYGESGVGKTSTLRMIAGLLKPDTGSIRAFGSMWFDSSNKVNLRPQDRHVGLVFQDYALFPNMSVKENLEFARKDSDSRVLSEVVEIVELGDLQNRMPETLSGGQKQRVALARALVQKPRLLLLDEPLSALDAKIRIKLQDYLLKVHTEFELTTVLVSHDMGEIHKLSNRVYIIEEGKIAKEGVPSEVFLSDKISGKFKFAGEILKIEKQDVIFVITVLIQNEIVKVIAEESEARSFKVGDKVMVASKAFNPVIYKID